MILRNTFIRLIPTLALVGGTLHACTSPDDGTTAPGAGVRKLRPQLEAFADGAQTAQGEESVDRLDAYLFEQGRLSARFEGLTAAGDGFALQLGQLSGRLYLVANAGAEAIGTPEEGLSEQEWLAQSILSGDGAQPRHLTGTIELGSLPSGTTTLPVSLRRGYARFDLRILVAGEAAVERLLFTSAAREAYLFPGEQVATPAGAPTGEVEVRPDRPFTVSTPAVALLHEQASPELTLRVEALIDGKPCTFEKSLPAEIRRNTVYTVTLRRDIVDADVELTVEPWRDGGSTELEPDLDALPTVDLERSEIPDEVTVSEQRTEVTFPYYRSEMVLAVDCNDELELLPLAGYPLTVEPLANDGGIEGMNRFRIRKALYAPGMPADRVELRFHRKGLGNDYPEDCIVLHLEANPTAIEGPFAFSSPGYSYDFGRYVDNELGRFALAPGKELIAEFDGDEDPWVRIIPDAEEPAFTRVVAGWRPNDPKADGREQSVRLVIRNAADHSQREEYTVMRRNWGLPVTWFHGVWWCKYNSRGRSREFADQILPSTDPAVLAGKSLFNYLATCSPEEYYELWCWAYQGDSGIGQRVVDKEGVLVMDGFTNTNTAHINRLPADALSPDGYELPSLEEFNRMFDATDYIWMMWTGSHQLRNPWEGHATVRRTQQRRNDLTVGSVAVKDLLSVALTSPDFPDLEGVTWYGPGAQWNADGIKHSGHYNNMLFSVHAPDGGGWYITGGMGNLYMTKNAAGYNDTRLLRFKKSPVEFTY